ncbi:MAG: hypothetical protein K2N77_12845 [Lachnospiraceae bacterium]|nr:hypothetical protein [Lachnospiraceae bacterium]
MDTGKMMKSSYNPYIFVVLVLSGLLILLSGCGGKTPAVSDSISWQSGKTEEEIERELTEGNVTMSRLQLALYGKITDCSLQSDKETLALTLTMPDIPKSDDAMIYLFAFETYEECTFTEEIKREPIASQRKSTECRLECAYQDEYLFKQFVPAVLLNGEYMPLSAGICISNPEMLAATIEDCPQPKSKKGLLLDPQMLETSLLTDLGVQYAIYNIPLSIIMGETTDQTFPTISYEYQGKTYLFNGAAINGYDYLFSYLTSQGMNSTAIILNDWNETYPELIHPLSCNKEAGAYYYAFNTANQEGIRCLEAIASFLTERYSGKEHGLVSNWVIANEINQYHVWNYMDTDDIMVYAAEFEKALRIFYYAAKSNYVDAKVYFSIDHDWNSNRGNDEKYFNAKEVVAAVNEMAGQKGNYDWGLAIHPYPNPLTKVNYWTENYDKTPDAPVLTLMNLSTVTDFLSQEEYLDRNGNVRSITVTELGFTSASGEKLQAAAFAYCYYIIEDNPYVDAFIMNRQTDALEEVRQGLSFGIYEMDHTPKYICDVYKYIDTDEGEEYTKFMLNILGAESLEEALSWAK